MIKKHTIGRLLTIASAIFLSTYAAATAADKVVVIPLESGSIDSGGVRPVMSAGQVWMDRNLGAHRAAIKSDDSQAYGSLYQWGRLGDGHEYRESPTTTILSTGDVPGHGHFITVNANPYDWTATPNDNLWQGMSGINNPCPAGFRLPTREDWLDEIDSWSSQNAAGAFASPLRLVVAGIRDGYTGTIYNTDSTGGYRSSTVSTVGSGAHVLIFSVSAYVGAYRRSNGYSVRCIKD